MSTFDSPIPLSDIESVLAWVDTFKLSRPTRKINRDFSDAVLLAEILSVHYPKLVEMHNYPPRNSHSLKLNNWMTLNRKVLKKLKLNLCLNTMEQLANCAPGVIERVLIMVREKIKRDEEVLKNNSQEQNVSSGGSYYEACGDEEHYVLVVPIKTRVNGVLETIQQKVVSYETFMGIKEELKDAKESYEVLKQKVDHLDNLLKLKEERIEELQKQLERKQARKKEVEASQNPVVPIVFPNEPEPPSPKIEEILGDPVKPLVKPVEIVLKSTRSEESRIPVAKSRSDEIRTQKTDTTKVEDSKMPVLKSQSKPSLTEVTQQDCAKDVDVNRIKSDVFKEIEIIDQRTIEGLLDNEEFKDSDPGTVTEMEINLMSQFGYIPFPNY
ncbi:sperm flagellar protein 1-like [Leptidea sinapis]|uniref:sperm flagellar protein 1-like n=1 Tax=Leptidea sinapis TaxID=189913 RepID=UPI002131518C|nr:sperm flagellar protein 1-like [Leptidea sinapis]